MIRSMTGFAERRFDSDTLSARITIRALNHRYFDWSFRGSQMWGVESQFRALCQKMVHRGRVEVFLDLSVRDPERWQIRINENLLGKVLAALDRVSATSGRHFTLPVESLFNIPNLVEMREKELPREEVRFLEQSFEKALAELVRVRNREGRVLRKEILGPVKRIKRLLRHLETRARRQPSVIRKKLEERLMELGHQAALPEEKLLQEAAYLAQRFDMAEEIARLKSHLAYVEELCAPEREEPVGKKLDFVAQELYREANTINSKAQDIAIIQDSLAIKGEVESIRQQVQNLE